MGLAETLVATGLTATGVGTAVGAGLRALFTSGMDDRIRNALDAAKAAWLAEAKANAEAVMAMRMADTARTVEMASKATWLAEAKALVEGKIEEALRRSGSYPSALELDSFRRELDNITRSAVAANETAARAVTTAHEVTSQLQRLADRVTRLEEDSRVVRLFREEVLVRLGVLGERIDTILEALSKQRSAPSGGTYGRG